MPDPIRKEVEIDLTIEDAAKWFCSLGDDEMADFLIRVEAESRKFEGMPETQWAYLGGHLRNCECSNEETRDMLRSWVWHMEHSDHE